MKKIKLKKRPTKAKKIKSKKSTWKTILSIILAIAIVVISICLVFALYIVISSPDFEKNELYQTEPTVLYDKYGKEFARVGAEDSAIVTYDELPDVLVDSLVATEDSRFFQHNGLDLFRFLKASVLQLVGSDTAGGASTLSMQVIKNTYTKKGERENTVQSFIRKFRDIYMSVFKLEANYTKEEIIEFYLNSQWFANSGSVNTSGIEGVERASQYYFGKSVKDINLAEASLMAGMFQNPYLYNPYRNPEGCRNRQTTVLKLLVRHGYITEEQKEAVLDIPIDSMLVTKENSGITVESNQAFIDYVLNEVTEKTGMNPRQVSLSIYTTFDPKIQNVLEQVENGEIYEFPNDKVQESIAVTSTDDGSLVAISGGRNYAAQGLNRATVRNQPGSTAKPLLDYAMYIEHISQSSYDMFLDEPTTYSNGASISNYDRNYKGLISMRYALDDSRNIPALLAFKKVYALDPDIIKDFVHSVGIDYGRDLYESAAIGGFDGTSPIELSAAYGTFARGGYYIEPYAYTKVVNNVTGDETNYSYTKKQVMEESTAYMINNILLDAYGGKGPGGTTVAGKTGTTNLDKKTKEKYNLPGGALMDVWIVSYSPSYSISLWYGYDQIEKNAKENKYYLTSDTGGTARRRIMNGLATKIHEKNESFKVPKTLTKISVELETFPAQLCSEHTPSTMCVEEYFVKGTEPTEISKRYATLDNPTNGSYTYSGNTINLKWDGIKTPEAIDNNYLTNHFNEYYGDYATKYYDARIAYNSTTLGTLGYEIYLKNNGVETYIGFTNMPTFTYIVPSGGEYEFVVKTAYSLFKSNRSTGHTISAKTIDNNVNDFVEDNQDNDNSDDSTELN
ncbi:MAG: transglycosylase domain-containing protein [Bacilli bacterium]|nr:transglycosylase domain-containing protein [Bacilli bacterium]